MVGVRAKDEATGAKLYHTKDNGPLYKRKGNSYYFCIACDRAGRDPYVQGSSHVGFKNPFKGMFQD